jgi:hypothetical protein
MKLLEQEMSMLQMYRFSVLLGLLILTAHFTPLLAQQPIETETARPLKVGVFEVQTTFEYQTSKEGKELAAPLGFEYGITDRLSLLVEPIFYTSIRPKGGRNATGVGDLEVTLSYLVAKERHFLPALAIAGEVKIPTARDRLIGTGKTDFAAYLFASKRFGKIDTHANLGYTFVGKPTGLPNTLKVGNTVNLAFAGEYFVNKKLDLVAEVLSNTGAGESTTVSNPALITPEINTGELVGTAGFRYHYRPKVTFALGVSYDSNGAVLIRPGITFNFNLRGDKAARDNGITH